MKNMLIRVLVGAAWAGACTGVLGCSESSTTPGGQAPTTSEPDGPPYKPIEPADDPNLWKQVPLRSQVQLDAGLFGGEGMQMIYGLSYAPSNAKVVYLVSDTSQVWKSDNGGQRWTMKHRGFLSNGGLSIVVDPSDENIVFVAGSLQDSTGSDPDADGIYRTVDGGDNWERVYATAFASKKGGVNFAFAGAAIYAGTDEEGLLKSVDGGDSWTSVATPADGPIVDVRVHPARPAVIWVSVVGEGLFRIDDGAPVAVEAISAGISVGAYPRSIALHPADPQQLIVSLGSAGVYKSLDGGKSFAPCNTGLDLGQDGFTYLARSPVEPYALYASSYLVGGMHPYHSQDNCESWSAPEAMDVGDHIAAIHPESNGQYWSTPIAPSPSDANVAISSGGGNHINKTVTGGKHWTYSGDGYTGGRAGGLTSFAWDRNDPQRLDVFLTDFGPYSSKDGGKTFASMMYEGGSAVAGAVQGSTIVCAAFGHAAGLGLYVSHDDGAVWERAGELGAGDEDLFIAFHPQKPDIVYAGQFKSSDGGQTWDTLPKRVVGMFIGDGDIVYAYEDDDPLVARVVVQSLDGGQSWPRAFPPTGLNGADLVQLAVDVADSDRLYLATLDGVWISHDGGWHTRGPAHGLELDRFGSNYTSYLAVDPNRPEVIYAGKWIAFKGHANGVFRSTDRGESWQNITFNLGPEFTPWALGVSPHDGTVFVGSSHGTWKLSPPGSELRP